ncbi:MAG TPA: ankyrin repeat domain-containing protein [Verrucomicrobiota bacterium]|nr:ankyrin repeat domain-containing protein [Verrucomicrobiota bacterium]
MGNTATPTLVALALASGCGGELNEPSSADASGTGGTTVATNLFHAAQLGKLKALQQYLAQGQSVTNRHADNGQTALHYAAWGGHTNTITWLIEQKADINALDNDGKSPLDFAWMPRGEAARKILNDAGAKPGNKPEPAQP